MAKKAGTHPDVLTLRKILGDSHPLHTLFTDRVLAYRIKELTGEAEAGDYPPDLIPLDKVMKTLGVSHPTVCRMVKAGKFRAFQIAGGPRRYSESEVKSLVMDMTADTAREVAEFHAWRAEKHREESPVRPVGGVLVAEGVPDENPL